MFVSETKSLLSAKFMDFGLQNANLARLMRLPDIFVSETKLLLSANFLEFGLKFANLAFLALLPDYFVPGDQIISQISEFWPPKCQSGNANELARYFWFWQPH